MKTSAEKSSTTTSATATRAANRPFFPKAGESGFFTPLSSTVAPFVQMKMAVNKPGDKLELEADKMAGNVMRMPSPALTEKKNLGQTDEKLQKKEKEKEEKIQRAAIPEEKVAKKEEEKIQKTPEKEEKLQRKGGDGAPALGANTQSAIQNKTTGGQPLSGDVRGFMEPRFNADFSNVRIHSDAESGGLSNQLSARAFTYQNHIFFSRDQYQPGTSEGKQLLAHELTHTLQQGHTVQLKSELSTPGNCDIIQKAPASVGSQAQSSSQVVDLSSGIFNPSQQVKDEIEAQGDKGLDVRVIVKKLTSEGHIKVRAGRSKNYVSIGKGSMLLLNAWTQQLGGMYINFSLKNGEIKDGYASFKPGGRDTNDWLHILQKNSALLGGLGLKVENLPKPVNKFEGGKLKLGVTDLKVEIGGFLKALFNISVEDTNKPKIDATSDINIKGIVKGQLKIDNTKEKLTGEISLAVDYKSFSGSANVKYNPDGTVDIGGKAAYNADKLSGVIQFVATDLDSANNFARDAIAAAGGKENVQTAGPPAPVPVPKAGKKQRALAATGQLAFNLTTWFAGTVFVVVDGKGAVTVIGKIAPPGEIILFKQRDWDKELIKFEAKAYYGLPVVGNLNLFANISLNALASLGPAKIYNIEVLGTYSTDPEIQKYIQISGSINISAYAGLRLRAEGGAGIEILDHDLKFGIGLQADVGVKAYADARPTIGYRDPGIFYISGTLEMVAQPMLGLGGDFFIALETPWWSPLSDDRWTWPLFSKEWPLTDPIGINAVVKDYVLGSGTVPEIELKKPEFDPSKFMTNMVDRTLPDKSGGKGTGQGEFKEDGTVPKPTIPPKKPAPKKTDAKSGKKGAPPKMGKSGAPDPKAAKGQEDTKILKNSLEGLKNNAPYSKVELDKALGAIKGKVKGVSFNVQLQGDKWIVTPGGSWKKKSAGEIELALKKDGTISEWWKEKLGFNNEDKEDHTLQFIGTGDLSEMGIATTLMPVRTYLNTHRDKGTPDWNTADSVFSAAKQVIFSPAAKSTAEKDRRKAVKQELAKVSAAFAKLAGAPPTAGDYGDNTPPTYGNPAKVDVIVGETRKDGTRTGKWPTTEPGYKEIYDAGLTEATDPWVQMHIISEKLGGSGTNLNNLVPAPQSVNTGPFRSFEHSTVSLSRAKSNKIKNRIWVEVHVSGSKSAATGLSGKTGLYLWKGKKASPMWMKNESPSFTANVGIPVPQLSGTRKLVLNFTSGTEMRKDFGLSSTVANLVKEGRPYTSQEHFVDSMKKRGATAGQVNAVTGRAPVLNGP